MRTEKDKRGMHNRPDHGPWYGCDKDTAKRFRRMSKAVRHKLLFHIPLTPEEERWRNIYHIEADSALDREGYPTRRHIYTGEPE